VSRRHHESTMPWRDGLTPVAMLVQMTGERVEVGVVAWWATWPAETVRGRDGQRIGSAYELFRESIDDDMEERRQGEGAGKTFPPSCSRRCGR